MTLVTWPPHTVEPQSAGAEDSGAPLLSVTVLNYNYGRFLPRCLDSILSQTFKDFELIIIDDGSSDNSLELIQPYLVDPRIRLVAHEQNAGLTSSLIEGTEIHSRGEFVTVISADDLVNASDAFERQMTVLLSSDQMAFCCTGYERFSSADDHVMATVRLYDGDRILRGSEFLGDYLTGSTQQVLHSGTIIRKSIYNQCGKYRRDFRFAHDYALWQMLSLYGDIGYIDEPLYRYRIHDVQMHKTSKHFPIMMSEELNSVEASCTIAKRRGLRVESIRRRGIRQSLFAGAMDDAFAGQHIRAIRVCLLALRLRPLAALMAPELGIILARLLLGQRGFFALRSVIRKRAWIRA
jgi:glycosyltransferase involved in cell wall biosynthesis